MVVYAWHPWAGRSVYIHDVIERATGAAARCSLAGVAAARVQELPVWMLDTAACCPVRLTQEPMSRCTKTGSASLSVESLVL